MFSLAAAMALAAEPTPDVTSDPDLRCFVAIAFATGSVKDGDAAALAGLASIMLYYMGRLDARFPGFDYKRELTRLIKLPAFRRELPADMQRCGKEAEDRGTALQDLGAYLKGIAPLLDAQPG